MHSGIQNIKKYRVYTATNNEDDKMNPKNKIIIKTPKIKTKEIILIINLDHSSFYLYFFVHLSQLLTFHYQ